jgi:hypothetical protein
MKIYNIDWDTDNLDEEYEEEIILPNEVELPNNTDEDMIADLLSDMYGFCVNSFKIY